MRTLSCPNCGAPLDEPVDDSRTLRCPYCNTTFEAPAKPSAAPNISVTMRPAATLDWRQMRPVVRLIVVITVLLVVVPTCLGLAGSCLGLVAGIAGPLIAVILQMVAGR